MAEIGFYHLTRTTADRALPPLLGRTLKAGQRAVVLLASPDRVRALDAALWAVQEPDWLPHGTAATGDPDMQPIWLTDQDEAPNGARFAFLLDNRQTMRHADFTRIFDLFDGQDPDAVAAARVRWSAGKAAGHGLTYWQQGSRGWEKKA
jgi:DNA polymerase-3 subunit chi